MKQITDLEPRELWRQFARICSIPHPSKQEGKIREYVIGFAKEHGLDWEEDKIGNIVVRKKASDSYEKCGTVILQSHLDMVPQHNSDTPFHFETDPIRPYIDGDWVKAKGTTLGADNGIGVATMLAVLKSDDLEHPALECLFTVDEETGLTGANALGEGMLTGKTLINLDSEDEGELYVGCAGAVNATASFDYREESGDGEDRDRVGYQIAVSGLKGGHSGMEIILQRANANRLLARFLWENREKLRISTIDSGGLRNAIPREGKAIVAVRSESAAQFEKTAQEFERTLQYEWRHVEDSVRFSVRKVEAPAVVVPKDFQMRFVAAVLTVPDGIVRMSDTVPGLVETSTNMSRVEVKDGKAGMMFMVRCMVNYGKPQVVAQIEAVVGLAGGRVETQGDYDGWAPNPDSQALNRMRRTYRELYDVEPEVKAIHAGLECGIIGSKYPGLDMISIGPTIRFPHSPDEKVHIDTVQKFYDFLLYTLKMR